MTEHELRTALQEYVAAATPPAAARETILREAASRRRRTRVAVALSAAATVAAVAAVPLALMTGDSPDAGPIATPPEQTTTAPYDAKACPRTLPLPGEVNRVLPDLGLVESVRFCSDGRSRLAGEPDALDEGFAVHDPEALVEGLDDFAGQVAGIAPADPARCAAISVLPTNDALALTLADGRTVLVPASLCQDVQRGAAQVDGAALKAAFLEALDQQRESLAYVLDTDAALACDFAGQPGPARPMREQVTAAIPCASGTMPTPLGKADLTRLDRAWAGATQVAEPGCDQADDPFQRLVARTDRGDVLRIQASACGFLYTEDVVGGGFWRIPTTLAEIHADVTS